MKNENFTPNGFLSEDDPLCNLFDQTRSRMTQEPEPQTQEPVYFDPSLTPYFRARETELPSPPREPESILLPADKPVFRSALQEPDWAAYEESVQFLFGTDSEAAQSAPPKQAAAPDTPASQPPLQPSVLPTVPPLPLTEPLTQDPSPEHPQKNAEPHILQWDEPAESIGGSAIEAPAKTVRNPLPDLSDTVPEPPEIRGIPEAEKAAEAPQKKPRKKSPLCHILQAAVLALLGLSLAVFVLFLGFGNRTDRSIFGVHLISANTRGMEATAQTRERGLQGGFDRGALLLVRPAKPEALKPGDIIAVRANNEPGSLLIVSRFLRTQEQGSAEAGEEKPSVLITCDDQPPQVERSHPLQNLAGIKTAAIPFAGQLLDTLQQRRPLAVLFLCALGGSLVLFALYFYLPSKDKKTKHEKN